MVLFLPIPDFPSQLMIRVPTRIPILVNSKIYDGVLKLAEVWIIHGKISISISDWDINGGSLILTGIFIMPTFG